MYGIISVNNESEWGPEMSSCKTSQLNEALQWRQRLSVNTYDSFAKHLYYLKSLLLWCFSSFLSSTVPVAIDFYWKEKSKYS